MMRCLHHAVQRDGSSNRLPFDQWRMQYSVVTDVLMAGGVRALPSRCVHWQI